MMGPARRRDQELEWRGCTSLPDSAFTIAGTASTAAEAAAALSDSAPDVVLLDTITPDATSAIRQIRAINP